MIRARNNATTLRRLAREALRGGPKTTKQVARALGVATPTARSRLLELVATGQATKLARSLWALR
jgi:predicted ArsR family transcriptional regulator